MYLIYFKNQDLGRIGALSFSIFLFLKHKSSYKTHIL